MRKVRKATTVEQLPSLLTFIHDPYFFEIYPGNLLSISKKFEFSWTLTFLNSAFVLLPMSHAPDLVNETLHPCISYLPTGRIGLATRTAVSHFGQSNRKLLDMLNDGPFSVIFQ